MINSIRRIQAIMAGMEALQWKLQPADARLIIGLLNREAVTSVDDTRREQAAKMHAYLVHRVARLWGTAELAEPATAPPGKPEKPAIHAAKPARM